MIVHDRKSTWLLVQADCEPFQIKMGSWEFKVVSYSVNDLCDSCSMLISNMISQYIQ